MDVPRPRRYFDPLPAQGPWARRSPDLGLGDDDYSPIGTGRRYTKAPLYGETSNTDVRFVRRAPSPVDRSARSPARPAPGFEHVFRSSPSRSYDPENTFDYFATSGPYQAIDRYPEPAPSPPSNIDWPYQPSDDWVDRNDDNESKDNYDNDYYNYDDANDDDENNNRKEEDDVGLLRFRRDHTPPPSAPFPPRPPVRYVSRPIERDDETHLSASMLIFAKVSPTISKDTTACGSDRNAHILANWDKLSQGSTSQRGSRSHALSISSRTRSPSPGINDAMPRTANSENTSESEFAKGSATYMADLQARIDAEVREKKKKNIQYIERYDEVSRVEPWPSRAQGIPIPSAPTPPPRVPDSPPRNGALRNRESDFHVRERPRSQSYYDDDGE